MQGFRKKRRSRQASGNNANPNRFKRQPTNQTNQLNGELGIGEANNDEVKDEFKYKEESHDKFDDANTTEITFEEDIYCLAYIKMLNSDVPYFKRELLLKATLVFMMQMLLVFLIIFEKPIIAGIFVGTH